jgi:serine/threonine protein kinase
MEEQLLTELRILKQINHPNIVRAYEAFTDDFHIFILMEYIHGTLLVNKLKCSEKECKVIVRQVLEALKYLHENKITHRDIKPENIILTADNVVKICDFGWAAQGSEEMNILCGTLDYVSP